MELKEATNNQLMNELADRLNSAFSQQFVSPATQVKLKPGPTEYPATCAKCGKATTVPFKPQNDSPLFCRECYQGAKN